jgi:hypothetical protein
MLVENGEIRVPPLGQPDPYVEMMKLVLDVPFRQYITQSQNRYSVSDDGQ